jgi:hypothetical protein
LDGIRPTIHRHNDGLRNQWLVRGSFRGSSLRLLVRSPDLPGVTYYDLALIFSDGSTQSASAWSEAAPEGLKAEDRVLVTMAANMVVSLCRPSGTGCVRAG